MSSPVLLDLGATAFSHQSEVNEVKQQLGITHPYFDCWIYGFLENKSFNIAETVAKLRRRADFERNVLSQADITDWMVENMQKGIIQVIGNDKDGRVTLYVTTSRDKPKSIRRAESKKNFDMFVSYATRLRAESKRCQLAMLINQEGASMWSNMDMTFQADIALHIAKFYPGCVDKMYICKMNRTLAAMAKPIFSRLPSIVSDRIIIISDGDMKRGKLLELFDENVLPIALGGQNDCDKEENYTRFSNTIKDYFNELRAAICRGESVKEWELGKLRAAGLIEPPKTMDGLRRSIVAMDRSKSSYHGGASSSAPLSPSFRDMRVNYSSSEDDEGVEPNLLTCESLRGYDDLDRVGSVGASLHVRCAEQSLLSDYLSQFLSIETFFRLNLTEVHEREWTHLLRLEMEERKAVHHREQTYSGDRLLTRMPSAARHAIHSFLTLTRLVMSFFFLLGTLFIATLGGLSVTYIFFAMFSKPYNFFLYGLAFIAVMGNFTLFCCRGYELTHSAFRGKVLHVLSAFGTRALIFQVAIYSIGTVSYFIVFCIMAARHDVFTGLQYCASIGWIVAVCLTFIYHVLYALGFRSLTPAASHPHRSGDRPEATMYLFMNLDIEDETQMTKGSEVMTIVVLGVLSFASGVAFMAGGGVFFIVATVLLQTLVLLCSCVFLSASKYTAVASAVIMFCALYVSLFWLSVVFTMTTYGWNDGYGGSLITSLVVSLIFCTTGLLSLFGPWSTTVRTWLFRVLWLMILIQAVGALIALMVNNYRMGLFALALGIHFLLCSVRANSSFNSFGILFVALAFLIFVLSCCIEGHANAAQLYATPASRTLLPDYHTTMSDANISHSMRAPGGLPPICQLHYPDRKMDTTGMALFAKLGYNTDPLTQAIDLARWFPEFTQAGEMSTQLFAASAFRRTSPWYNLTVIAVRPGNRLYTSIDDMTMWVSAYSLVVFSVVLPTEFLVGIVPYLSFVSDMCPLGWQSALKSARTAMNHYVEPLLDQSEYVYLVGQGTIGASAAVVALQNEMRLKSILFSSPQIMSTMFGIDLTEVEMSEMLVSVLSTESAFASTQLHLPTTQTIPCTSSGGRFCDELNTMARQLFNMCNTWRPSPGPGLT